MTDFAQAFQNDQNNISDAVKWDQSAASQVILSHRAKSHDFLMGLGEFIRKMHFHLPLFTLTIFRTSQKPPQASVKIIWELRDFFPWNLVFPSLVSHTSKCALKQGVVQI